MPESTLNLTYTDLKGQTGLFLGYGQGTDFGEPAWTAGQSGVIVSLVRSGLRQFYWPPPLEQGGSSYDWSFLKPVSEFTLASGTHVVPLPDDFGGFEGELAFTQDGTSPFMPLPLTGIGHVDAKFAMFGTSTGWPQLAAVEPIKGTTPTAGQRFQLKVWPTAADTYTIRAAYYLLPDALTGAQPNVYGGAQHAETVLASCRAAAEVCLDDQIGPQWQNFMQKLATSVSIDRRLKPQVLGYNGDRSDDRERRRWRRNPYTVTYQGQSF